MKTEERTREQGAGYTLEGTLLEACSCGVLCPCWIGEDPDGGECLSFEVYHFDAGQIDGVDVSGLTYVQVEQIPGNVLTPGSQRTLRIVDVAASDEQREAILRAFRGELGGPLADLAALVGEELGVESLPIEHRVEGGRGTVVVPGVLEADMEPYRGPDGTVTTLRDSAFSTVPGSPAWVAKAHRNRVSLPKYGLTWDFEGRNAIQSEWRMEHR